MYYGILTLSVVMFGVQFLFSDRYGKENGNRIGAVFTLSLFSSIAGLVCLLLINGFHLSFTLFTLLCATAAAANSILYSLCSLKALARINLSLYSLFAMLGGMLLPFLAGLLFYDEPMTLGKGVCVVLVVAALLCTVKGGAGKGGTGYYIGVFVLNGMSGVISKFYNSAPFEKAAPADYSLWIAIVTAVVSAVVLVAIRRLVRRPSPKAVLFALGKGAMNQVANFLLLVALTVLPSSVQYPFVTGGTMIVSTVISALTGEKPSKKELVAVALSFVGILALVLL